MKIAVLQYWHVCSAIAHSFLLIEQPKSSWMLQPPEMAHLIQHGLKKYFTYIGYWGTGQQQAGRSPDLRQACRNPQRGDLGQPWLWGYHNKQPLGLRCLKDGVWLYRLYPINPMWHDGGTYGFVQRKSGTFKIELIASSLSSWKLHSPSFAGISAGKFDMATEIYFFLWLNHPINGQCSSIFVAMLNC